jgi:hypothetical protein
MTPKDEISSVHVDARLSEFEKKLDRLYRQFEQYFVGVEKRPPHQGRREVVRLYRELEQTPMIRTDLKFRFRSLTQRLNSYKTYWTRIERQIEDGTYHRDLARAKARQKRRAAREEREEQREEQQTTGRAEDGAFEIDDWDFDELDLSSLEQEFEQMDERGEFEKYVGTRKVSQPDTAQPAEQTPAAPKPAASRHAGQTYRRDGSAPEVDSEVKKQRLAELQAKLGLSTRAAPSGGINPFERGSEGATQKARPENPSAPGRGADISKLRKLRRAKERIAEEKTQPRRPASDSGRDSQSERPARKTGRVINRSAGASSGSVKSTASAPSNGGFSDEKSRKIYNTLVEAKQRCKEDTSRLNYDTFKRTIERQRTQIQRSKGARDVDFKVVIKEGRVFLKPETKE